MLIWMGVVGGLQNLLAPGDDHPAPHFGRCSQLAWAPRQIPALFTRIIPDFGRFGIPEHFGKVRESKRHYAPSSICIVNTISS